jgi:hypothetical protein
MGATNNSINTMKEQHTFGIMVICQHKIMAMYIYEISALHEILHNLWSFLVHARERNVKDGDEAPLITTYRYSINFMYPHTHSFYLSSYLCCFLKSEGYVAHVRRCGEGEEKWERGGGEEKSHTAEVTTQLPMLAAQPLRL